MRKHVFQSIHNATKFQKYPLSQTPSITISLSVYRNYTNLGEAREDVHSDGIEPGICHT